MPSAQMESVHTLARHVLDEMGKVIVGQESLKRQCLVVLLCEGHALIEGAPGLAKTLAVKTLAQIFRLEYQRVQCTPDLMPADVIGTNVLNMASGAFTFHNGPAFTQLLLVDEINRMPPRTQAALLEAMEERHVTVDRVGRDLSPFFTVFATQNPIEFEGTYPLPEAQLDRFLIKIRVPYPEAAEEVRLLSNVHGGFDARRLDALNLAPIGSQALGEARRSVRAVNVEESLFGYIAQLVRRTREWPAVSLGASPRAAVALMLASKAVAAMEGRDFVVPDDVKDAAVPVLRHRIVVKPEADLEGITSEQVVEDVIRTIEVPQ
jgi:MoxR-like ATPase